MPTKNKVIGGVQNPVLSFSNFKPTMTCISAYQKDNSLKIGKTNFSSINQ